MIQFAPFGWPPLTDAEIFFPDDLPPDWRLAFFAGRFSALCLPLPARLAGDGPDPSAWAEDVPADFRFFFLSGSAAEKPADGALPAQGVERAPVSLSRSLGAAFGGLLLPGKASAAGGQGLTVYHQWPDSPGLDDMAPGRASARWFCRRSASLIDRPRDARAFLQRFSAAVSAAPALVVLDEASSAQLERWGDLGRLLGLVCA